MENIFFTSDLHFGHKNIIKFEDRPFESVEEMDEKLIKNWNNKVAKSQSIYILGDFCFSDKEYAVNLLNKLNGNKMLVKGNHDHVVKNKEVADKFCWIKDYYLLKYNGLKIALFHYPMKVWDCKHYGSIHLFGHVHSNKEDHHPMVEEVDYSYNVGVDVNGMAPISLKEILTKIDYKLPKIILPGDVPTSEIIKYSK